MEIRVDKHCLQKFELQSKKFETLRFNIHIL